MDTLHKHFIISVLAPDKPGIIAAISETLYGMGGNIEAISQTNMLGWFTMILQIAFQEGTACPVVKQALESIPQIQVIVCPRDEAATDAVVEGDPFVVTAVGDDKPGIVLNLTKCFARRKINIDDVWNEVRDNQFIVIFHVTLPLNVDPKEIRTELEQSAQGIGVSVLMQHQNIFTSTNSLALPEKR